MGLAKFEIKDFKAAIVDFDDAIKIRNTHNNAYYSRGWAKEQLKDYKGALEDYNAAIQIDATVPDYFLKRGNLKIKMGSKKSGALDLQQNKELRLTRRE